MTNSAHEIAQHLVDALGLRDKNVTSISIKFKGCSDRAEVEVSMLVPVEGVAVMVDQVRHFHLVPIERTET